MLLTEGANNMVTSSIAEETRVGSVSSEVLVETGHRRACLGCA